MKPGKIICIGWNYRSHLAETNAVQPKEPIVFLKPSSCLTGDGMNIVMPYGLGAVHYEGELAIIFGKSGKNISREEAIDHISHAAAFNDVTARDLQTKARSDGNPWCISKGMDTFGPMSEPVSVKNIGDLQDLEIELTVNGTVKQKSNTSMMIFPLDVLIEYVSRFMIIEKGDIMATGTPEGIGPLVVGDVVTVRIDKVGSVTNRVV